MLRKIPADPRPLLKCGGSQRATWTTGSGLWLARFAKQLGYENQGRRGDPHVSSPLVGLCFFTFLMFWWYNWLVLWSHRIDEEANVRVE